MADAALARDGVSLAVHRGPRGVASRAVDRIGRDASLALYRELALAPKPGLVSFRDNGSHTDMDAGTFMRSIFALRRYFPAIAHAGAQSATFAELESLGKDAEARMLEATEGINTHRGAIFALGLLCAAGGHLSSRARAIEPEALRATVRAQWGAALSHRAARAAAAPARSKGRVAAQAYGLRSAGEEAADAFPALFDVTFPALCAGRAILGDAQRAMVHALFATIAVLDDTNLAHRGGIDGLGFARSQARSFVRVGSVFRDGWQGDAQAVHDRFVARRLSPGGAADMLACACWLERLCGP